MITVECPHCGTSIKVDEKYVGKKGRCNKCREVFTVTAPSPASTEDLGVAADDPFGGPGIDPFGASGPAASASDDPFGAQASDAAAADADPFGASAASSAPPDSGGQDDPFGAPASEPSVAEDPFADQPAADAAPQPPAALDAPGTAAGAGELPQPDPFADASSGAGETEDPFGFADGQVSKSEEQPQNDPFAENTSSEGTAEAPFAAAPAPADDDPFGSADNQAPALAEEPEDDFFGESAANNEATEAPFAEAPAVAAVPGSNADEVSGQGDAFGGDLFGQDTPAAAADDGEDPFASNDDLGATADPFGQPTNAAASGIPVAEPEIGETAESASPASDDPFGSLPFGEDAAAAGNDFLGNEEPVASAAVDPLAETVLSSPSPEQEGFPAAPGPAVPGPAPSGDELVVVSCPHCGIPIELPRKYVGTRGRCNSCAQVFTVPEPAATAGTAGNAFANDVQQDFAAGAAVAPPAAAQPSLSALPAAPPPAPAPMPPMPVPGATSAPAAMAAGSIANLSIDTIEATLVNLPCSGSLWLAGGTLAAAGQPAPRILVKMVGSNGVIGWGEVTPCPSWCYETSETILTSIRNYLAPAVRGLPAWNVELIARTMEHAIRPGATIGQPLAKSGIDMALHDMLARTQQVPLYVLFGGKRWDEIWLSYTVSARTPEEAASLVRQGTAQGFSAFKVALSAQDEATDGAIAEAVAQTAARGSFLWFDANQGYTLDTALRQAKRLGHLGAAAFEQPLPGTQLSAYRRLVGLQAVPIALDETLGTPADLMEHIKADAVDLPVVNLQRCAGHWRSSQLGAVARAGGLRLLGSGLGETDLGLAHSLHHFAALGVDLPCDLSGRQWVESCFLRETVEIANGRARIPDRPGCGVEVDEDLVRRYAVDV